MIKILKGLNSNTFNYLEHNKNELGLNYAFSEWVLEKDVNTPLTSLSFFSQCVRINKPCRFIKLAKHWPALEKWSVKSDGQQYLNRNFAAQPLEIFT